MAAAVGVAAAPRFARPASRTIIDSAGRKLALARAPQRVFPAGPPASILVFALAPETLLGWTSAFRAAERPFVPERYANLPTLGRLTGRGNTANIETVLVAKPDLVIDYGAVNPTYVSLADRVQAQTGIPYLLIDGANFYASLAQDVLWQRVAAVQSGRVHLAPGVPFGWIDFPPSINRLIGLRWLAHALSRRVRGGSAAGDARLLQSHLSPNTHASTTRHLADGARATARMSAGRALIPTARHCSLRPGSTHIGGSSEHIGDESTATHCSLRSGHGAHEKRGRTCRCHHRHPCTARCAPARAEMSGLRNWRCHDRLRLTARRASIMAYVNSLHGLAHGMMVIAALLAPEVAVAEVNDPEAGRRRVCLPALPALK